MNDPKLSVVIPVYNEQENLPELYERLTATLQSLKLPYEIIFVDDGSRDESRRLLRERIARDSAVRALFFSRNFGHQPAIAAGIDHTRGEAVVVLDADLQDPPELIPQLIEKWREGFEVVYAVRKNRKEPALKRCAYALFYRLMRWAAHIEIPLDAGDFSLMDRKVVELLRQMPERNRFIRGLRSWTGFRQTGLEYDRQPRRAGETKYSFGKLVQLAVDGFLSFSYVPLRASVFVGLTIFLLCLVYIGYALYQKLSGNQPPPGWTSLVVAVMFLGGLQLVLIGVVGEYIARIYDEVRQRPYYIVEEKLNCDPQPPHH